MTASVVHVTNLTPGVSDDPIEGCGVTFARAAVMHGRVGTLHHVILYQMMTGSLVHLTNMTPQEWQPRHELIPASTVCLTNL
jgi:hypothetical protein